MAKQVGYEVTAMRPVCVDFPDGRVVSFRPGMRFIAHPANSSVIRLLRIRDVRQLSALDNVPVLPVKLGAPHKIQNILKTRAEVAQARRKAEAAAKAKARAVSAPPSAVNLASPIKKTAPSSENE